MKEMIIGGTQAVKFFVDQVPILGTFFQRIDAVKNEIEIEYIKKYLIELSKYIEEKHTQYDNKEYIDSNQGRELFYLSVEKSAKIRSEEKREYLRNLFLNHSSVEIPMNIDNAERYLTFIKDLDIESILILDYLNKYTNTKQKRVIEYITMIKNEFDFQDEDLMYYHQQLIGHGLIIDDSIGKIGNGPFRDFSTTKIGKLFLDFIKEPI